MVIALYLAGCTLILPAEITQKVGFAVEPSDSGEVDSGETGDTGVVDTGETGSETGETGDTGGETGVDTGDTDTGADTGLDTSDTATDTSDTADTAVDTSVDTSDTAVDTADTSVDTATEDADGDGYPLATDCDDTDAAISPGADEVCDGVDNDCDGTVDESSAADAATWYADTDGDGFGDAAYTTLACDEPAAYVADATDCDDTDASLPDVLAGCAASYSAASGATMIYLTGGTFSMGSGLGDSGGSYLDHDVTLSHHFYLAQTETTRGEWETDPSNTSWTYSSLPSYPCTGTTADCPADTMTWYDAGMYANWLSTEEGLTECYLADGTDMAAAYLADPYSCPGYRLPTEAEWEYAARAGVDTTYSGSNTAANVAWTHENAYTMGTYAHSGCSLAANAWGFCDMSGNVWEWTNDWYDSAYGGYGSGVATSDPPGPASGSYRVVRGGYWSTDASLAAVAYRNFYPPSFAYNYCGFRLARSIP
ncbi:hypothetical protein LBMAG42_03430 [Deltaproteobacteria bacterium]|nr:hypothetical protein LBMAG42_03430 [Deltaproteobacteria bacterium]